MQARHIAMSDLKTEQKKRNLRTALILGVIAAMFMFGVIAKRLWFV